MDFSGSEIYQVFSLCIVILVPEESYVGTAPLSQFQVIPETEDANGIADRLRY